MSLEKYAYFDNAATTLVDDNALNTYIHICKNVYANPSSLHKMGHDAKYILEQSRNIYAKYMNVNSDNIYFTSSGTEANNIVLRSVLNRMQNKTGRTGIVISDGEHSSVHKTVQMITNKIFIVPLDKKGYVDINAYKDILYRNRHDIALISIIMAQNEIGTIQNIAFLSNIAKKIVDPNIPFHSDATQAMGKYYVYPSNIGIDLMTMSAHKYHGPRGVGILYARDNMIDTSFSIITGGGQEKNCRSGTENVAAIAAAAVAFNELYKDNTLFINRKNRIKELRDYIHATLRKKIPHLIVNSDLKNGLYNLLSISLPSNMNREDENIVKLLSSKNIMVSGGSACNKGKPSRILVNLGLNNKEITNTIRISLSKNNTINDCNKLIQAILTI